ncbi:MAG: GNAT family N-acetyltransferase [Oscillochloris sp.]|nr:GNAT family N-acetyltransferase [Oscillochloris sp.]
MTSLNFTIEEFDSRSADDAAFTPVWELNEALRREKRPDDPPRPFAAYVARERNLPDFILVEQALARRNDGALIGIAGFGFDTSGPNAHIGQVDVSVLPAERRRGVGRALLAWAVERARVHNRRLLFMVTSSRIEAGVIVAERIGARRGLENRTSQLVLADLDRAMLRDWQDRAAERAADYELLAWDDTYPEEWITPFATLCEVMNTAPREDLDVEDDKVTPEKLRSWMRSMIASGTHAWTLVARRRSSGALAGFSEIFWTDANPTILNQGATAVHPDFRNLGLGRWLKAAMLDRVLRELPNAEFVRTGNAQSNAPMLAINVALGFKPYEATTIWQIETDTVAAYLTT